MNEEELYFYDEPLEKRDSSSVSDDIRRWQSNSPTVLASLAEFSYRLQLDTLTTLTHLLHRKLSRFKTSIKEDQILLKMLIDSSDEKCSETVHERSSNRIVSDRHPNLPFESIQQSISIVIYRLGQKQIIRDALKQLDNLQIEFRSLFASQVSRAMQINCFSSSTDIQELMDFEYWFSKEVIRNEEREDHNLLWRHSILPNQTPIMIVTRDLRPGSELMCIPFEWLLKSDDAEVFVSRMFPMLKESYAKQQLYSTDDQRSYARTSLLLFLMWERTNTFSKWRPFFELLDRYFLSPVLFDEQTLGTLEGTYLFDQILQVKEQYNMDFKELMDIIDRPTEMAQDKSPANETVDARRWSFDNYTRARAFLESRGLTFLKVVEDCEWQVPIHVLLPLPVASYPCVFSNFTQDFDTDSRTLRIRASGTIRSGEFLGEHYGTGLSHQLIFDFGTLCLENEMVDCLPIELALAEDAHFPRKLRLLQKNQVGLEHYLCGSGELPNKLLFALRVSVSTVADLEVFETISFEQNDPAIFSLQISPRNEMKTLSTLRQMLTIMLKAYNVPSKIECYSSRASYLVHAYRLRLQLIIKRSLATAKQRGNKQEKRK